MSQDERGPVPIDDGEIHEWLDGELNAVRAAELEALTHTSPAFAQRVAEARGLIAASSRILGALDEVPAGVLPRSSTEATAEAKPSKRAPDRAARSWSWRRVSSIAALLMVGVTGVFVARREPALREADVPVNVESTEADAAPASVPAPAAEPAPEPAPEPAAASAQTTRQPQQAPLPSAAPPTARVAAPSQPLRSASETPLTSQALAATPPPVAVPAPVRSADAVTTAKSSTPPNAAEAERRATTPPILGAARFSGATVLGAPNASSIEAAGNEELPSDVRPADLLFGVQRVQCAPGCVQVRIEVARDGRLRRWIQSLGQSTVTDTSTLSATSLTELTQRMTALRLDTLPAVLQLDGSKCYSVGSLRESLRVSFVYNNAPRQVMGLPWCTDGNHVLDRAAQFVEEAAALKLGRVSRLLRE